MRSITSESRPPFDDATVLAPTSESAARWAELQRLLHETLSRSADERAAYLDASVRDSVTRAEVEALVAAHERPGALDALAAGLMSPLATRFGTPDAPNVPDAPDAAAATPVVRARYRLLERIGGGGMGVVYRARDERLERDVALKFLPPHLSADPAAKKRFLVEARAAAALEHPNICTVHEIGDAGDGRLYIVMAFYDGETLDRRIARGPLALDEALHVAGEIGRGLEQAHERGIVHCDVKPANVAITADGRIKVLDFGIARLADASATQAGRVAGTVAYMSPEQSFGEPIDHRTDVWSLGVVLYEMLSGRRPFQGPNPQAILFASLSDAPEPVAHLRPGTPAELDALVDRALAKRPADRFESMTEMLEAIARCAVAARSSAAPATPEGEPARAGPAEATEDSVLGQGGERRQVTVVACLIVGHEALVEWLAPEDADRVVVQLRDAAVEAAARFGGIVNHGSGDALEMLFGVPTAHEDDPVRAVYAALAFHARVAAIVAALDDRFADVVCVRSGIHGGPVVARRLRDGDRRFRIIGAPVDMGARLAGAAEPDAILLSPECRRLVAPFVRTTEAPALPPHAGAAAIVPHRVLGISSARSRISGAVHVGLTPFVGRERERAVLVERLTAACRGEGGVAVIVGEAGAGKSRLLHELRAAAAAAGARVLAGRCDAFGGSTPFLPFVEAAHEALGVSRGAAADVRRDATVAAVRALGPALDDFLPLYLTLLGTPSDAHPVPEHLRGELFQSAMLEAIAALFTVGASSAPTVLLLDDWHWADAASRAALRQLAEVVPTYPLLVVVASRPDDATSWETAAHQVVLTLAPLDGAATTAIVGALLGGDRVDAELLARLHARTGGNPFFLEELCEALQEEGAFAMRDGEITATRAADAAPVPETVQGVLRTRIDRLDPAARDLLRVASVIGAEFALDVLADVARPAYPLLSLIERLVASGLIVRTTGRGAEASGRFKHALTQEVAYGSLLEHQRVRLHGAVGHAIERRHATSLEEHVERLAHHFACAEAWEEAVGYGIQAADRAAALSQNEEALQTLERVETWILRLPDHPMRRELQADVLLRQERLCETMGLRDRQLTLVESLIGLLAPHGPSTRLAQAYLRRGDAFTLLHRFDAAEGALETSRRIAVERGDATAERNALRSIALLRMYEGRHREALSTIERVVAMGRAAGDTRAEAGDLATQANVLRAMGEHGRAIAVLEEALERTAASDNKIRHAALLNVIGNVYRDLGDHETALAYLHRVETQGLEPRHPINASFTLPAIADVQLQQGRIEEALATYRKAVELNRKARYADGLAHASRSLGEALAGVGRPAEAVAHLREAAALFARLEDAAAEALMWRRLATVHEQLDAPEDARAAWERVRTLARAGARADEAEAVEGIARAERRLGVAPERVVARYEEALGLAVAQENRARELSVRNALGIVHWQRHAWAEATAQYELALRLCREAGDRVHEGLILISLGATLHRQRRWDEARSVLLDGLRVACETGERRVEAHALSTLGEVELASGRANEAQARVEGSLALRRALGDRRGEGWMLEHLARVLIARGDRAAARAAIDAGATIARQLGDGALRAALSRLCVATEPTDPRHP